MKQLTWNWEVISSHAQQVRVSRMSLVPPQEAILDILCVSGKVVIKFIANVGQSWGKAGQILKDVIGRWQLQRKLGQNE